jgi:hypothetical protein
MDTRYIDWLRLQGVPLFEGAGISWRVYNGALVPATAAPCFVSPEESEVRRLLKSSGAWFARYSSDPQDEPTQWWYIVCDRYDASAPPSRVRSEINRSRRQCRVERVQPDWLADNAYSCYRAAFGRYGGVEPASEEEWRKDTRQSIGGPFEFWGVFVGERLAGYARCILEGGNVGTSAIRLDPDYLKDRVSYALVHHLLSFYTSQGGKTVSNGNRSVVHETAFQDFLVKFGFRRQFCRLNITYRSLLGALVATVFPFRRAAARLPLGRTTERAKTLFLQEEWRRSWSASPRSAAS